MRIQFYMPHGLERSDWAVFFRVVHRRNPVARICNVVFRLSAGLLSAVMGLLAIGILVSEDANHWGAVPPLFLGLILLIYAIFRQRINFWFIRRQQLAAGVKVTVTIADDSITDASESITTRYEYAAFLDICYCQNTYLLFLDKRRALVLPERCREGGGSQELKQFLEEKIGKPIRYIK